MDGVQLDIIQLMALHQMCGEPLYKHTKIEYVNLRNVDIQYMRSKAIQSHNVHQIERSVVIQYARNTMPIEIASDRPRRSTSAAIHLSSKVTRGQRRELKGWKF